MLGGRASPRDPARMTGSELLDAAGRRRSPATMPGFHCGRPPRNKGRSYPADPPTVEEIVAVMRRAGDRTAGLRTRALIVLLWRAGLRISEALSLTESDLDPKGVDGVRGAAVVWIRVRQLLNHLDADRARGGGLVYYVLPDPVCLGLSCSTQLCRVGARTRAARISSARSQAASSSSSPRPLGSAS
jgi:integrase